MVGVLQHHAAAPPSGATGGNAHQAATAQHCISSAPQGEVAVGGELRQGVPSQGQQGRSSQQGPRGAGHQAVAAQEGQQGGAEAQGSVTGQRQHGGGAEGGASGSVEGEAPQGGSHSHIPAGRAGQQPPSSSHQGQGSARGDGSVASCSQSALPPCAVPSASCATGQCEPASLHSHAAAAIAHAPQHQATAAASGLQAHCARPRLQHPRGSSAAAEQLQAGAAIQGGEGGVSGGSQQGGGEGGEQQGARGGAQRQAGGAREHSSCSCGGEGEGGRGGEGGCQGAIEGEGVGGSQQQAGAGHLNGGSAIGADSVAS